MDGTKSEDRGQKAEDRGQKAEVFEFGSGNAAFGKLRRGKVGINKKVGR